MKMSMVGPSYWDGFVKGVPGGEDDFSNLLNILDFPMESLEGDEELAGDWDASKSQSLGPIPLDALMSVPYGNVCDGGLDTPPKPNVPGAGTAHKKQLLNHVKESSRVIIPRVNAISETQEFRSFRTHSPVSVLESGGSCSGGKSLPIKTDIVVPGGTRSKRARASPFNPWFVMTPISYASATSKETPSYKKNKEKKKKKLSQLSPALNDSDDFFQQAKEGLFHASDVTEKNETSLRHSDATKKCTHCEVTKTPQWREGPMGPKTLCNACGVRYRSGRLFPDYRPAASPTFVPTLHSRVSYAVSASKKTLSYKKNKEKKKKKKLSQLSPALNDSDDSFQHAKEELFHASDVTEQNETSLQCSGATKKCTHCGVTKTPQWREGPMGPKTLCNACGVRYRSGRLFPEYRPAASPTFVPTLHSNSHRKVVEMRKKAMHETAVVHDASISPTPEFVPMSSYLFDFIY